MLRWLSSVAAATMQAIEVPYRPLARRHRKEAVAIAQARRWRRRLVMGGGREGVWGRNGFDGRGAEWWW